MEFKAGHSQNPLWTTGQINNDMATWANAFHFTLATFSNDISAELQKHRTDLCDRAIFGKIYTANAKLYIDINPI